MKVRSLNHLVLWAVIFVVALIAMNCFMSLLWMVPIGISLLGLSIGLFNLITDPN